MEAPTTQPSVEHGRAAAPPAFVWIPAALVALAMLLPPFYLIVRTGQSGAGAWRLIFNASVVEILARSVVLVVLVTIVCTILGVALAWLTVKTDIPFKRTFTVLTALPLVIPSYVFAILVVRGLGPGGELEPWLAPFGIDRMPNIAGLPGSVLTLSLLSYPYVMLPVRATLHRMDPSLEEAARGLGKGSWSTFTQVTLPLMRPAAIAGALLVALYTLSDFGAVSILGYKTFTLAIFIRRDSALDPAGAAALSLVLIALAAAILVLESWTRGRARFHRVTPGTARVARLVTLGRWRWPVAGAVGFLAFASLIAPMALLLFWVFRGLGQGQSLTFLGSDLLNTLGVSLAAAIVAAMAGIPIAVLSVRYPSKVAALLERMTFVGFALPGVAVALAFVFFASAVARPLYATTVLLVIAYLVLFLPASVGAIQASMRQVSPRIEEAARGLGKTSFQAFRLITLPLVMRGVLAGAALVFLLTMKELPATLILAPPGFDTLATSIWGAWDAVDVDRAAFASLLLVLLASVPMAVIVVREGREEAASASPTHRPQP